FGNGAAGLVTDGRIADAGNRRPSPGKSSTAHVAGNSIILCGRVTNGGACRAGNGGCRVNRNSISKRRPGTPVGNRSDDIGNIDRGRSGVGQTLGNGTAGLSRNSCVADACDRCPSPGKSRAGHVAGNGIILRDRITNGSAGSTGYGGCRVNGNHIIECRPGAPIGCWDDDIGNCNRRVGGIHQSFSDGAGGLPGNSCIVDACNGRPSPGKSGSGYTGGDGIILRTVVTGRSAGSAGNGWRWVNGNRIRKCRPGASVGCRGDDISNGYRCIGGIDQSFGNSAGGLPGNCRVADPGHGRPSPGKSS